MRSERHSQYYERKMSATFSQDERAIETFHLFFRKYALCIEGRLFIAMNTEKTNLPDKMLF